MRRVLPLLFVLLLAAPAAPGARERKPFTPESISELSAVRDYVLSPDGKWVVYQVTETQFAKDRRRSHLVAVPAAGGEAHVLTSGEGSEGTPRFTPDMSHLAFLSSRNKGGRQVFLLPWTGPGEPVPVTEFPGGIDDFLFVPDGTGLVFAARTWPECGADVSCIRKRDRSRRLRKVSAQVHEHLLYRHWDTYDDGKVQHLFYQPFATPLPKPVPRDLTPELKFDALCFWLLSAGQDFTISPDGRWVYFAGTQAEDRAVSYNHDIYRVPVAGGPVEQVTENPASDMHPRLSPDGRTLAWRGSRRPGYESDRYELMVMELESREVRSLTADLDRSVGALFWGPRGKRLYFGAENQGNIDLYSVSRKGGRVESVMNTEKTGPGYHYHVAMDPKGRFFTYLYRPLAHYFEVFRCRADGTEPEALTEVNRELYETVYVPDHADEVWFEGADRARVHGFVVPPRDYDPAHRYPLMVRIHGGPQQMFGYAFRYEFALFASQGYFVFFCNPRGSTGYGQAFTDGVRGDWGGKPIEDLKAGVRHVLAKYPAIDPARVGGWGGSYGGYVVNWLQGHNDDGLFAALVSHAGGADRWSAYGTTEELWFPEWEMHGPPWENPALMDELSPIRYAKHFKTPQLITHGDLDYRVRVTGGEAMFTALQRLGVPSKLIRFPDENHWIMKPHNQRFWYGEIVRWFDRWLKPGE